MADLVYFCTTGDKHVVVQIPPQVSLAGSNICKTKTVYWAFNDSIFLQKYKLWVINKKLLVICLVQRE